MGASLGQRSVARTQHRAGVSAAAAADRGGVAERAGGGAVWLASGACGIRSLGGGTQGCPQHVFRVADAVVLCAVCWGRRQKTGDRRQKTEGGRRRTGTGKNPRCKAQSPKPKAQSLFLLLAGFGLFRAGVDEQADAGHLAVRPVAAGLLALGPVQNRPVRALLLEKAPFLVRRRRRAW